MHHASCTMHHACVLTATVSSFFGAAAFCTTKIDDFRASLTLTSLTTSSTDQFIKDKVIDVDQYEQTNDGGYRGGPAQRNK